MGSPDYYIGAQGQRCPIARLLVAASIGDMSKPHTAGPPPPHRRVPRWREAMPDSAGWRRFVVHLPVEVSDRVRRLAFEHDVPQSDVLRTLVAAGLPEIERRTP